MRDQTPVGPSPEPGPAATICRPRLRSHCRLAACHGALAARDEHRRSSATRTARPTVDEPSKLVQLSERIPNSPRTPHPAHQCLLAGPSETQYQLTHCSPQGCGGLCIGDPPAAAPTAETCSFRAAWPPSLARRSESDWRGRSRSEGQAFGPSSTEVAAHLDIRVSFFFDG
jgi:hypothetical protein